MGTRSRIGRELPDGRIEHVFCQFDGYPQRPGAGWVLLNHFQDPDRAARLIDGGSLASMTDPEARPNPSRHPPGSALWRGPATALDRDDLVSRKEDAEFLYLLTREGRWLCHGRWPGEGCAWRDLAQCIERLDAERRAARAPSAAGRGGPSSS